MDRRRINGPVAATCPPVFDEGQESLPRSRQDFEARGIFLKTGVTPAASGSAYLETEAPRSPSQLGRKGGGLKVSCTIHGPRALPRSAPFSPSLVVSTHVKFAPFATRQRRGYLRDSSERDLGAHLETAIRGAIIADRWPKSGVDIIVTIIEGDEEHGAAQSKGHQEWHLMNVLGACITVASAAIADAGIDCLDLVVGGTAAVTATLQEPDSTKITKIVVDPVVAESSAILAACCVAYLPERDEVTSLWLKGQLPPSDRTIHTRLVSKAVQAAKGSVHTVATSLIESL